MASLKLIIGCIILIILIIVCCLTIAYEIKNHNINNYPGINNNHNNQQSQITIPVQLQPIHNNNNNNHNFQSNSINKDNNDISSLPKKTPFFRGVNLGGWLLLEPWITPSLFEPYINSIPPVVDEYTLSKRLGREVGSQIFNNHWANFVTENDINELLAVGINTVRIPVGYWIIDIQPNEPYISGGLKYLIKIVKYCEAVKMSVIIDLHGAPGSQNGFDNSGQRGEIKWYYSENVERTYKVLSKLTSILSQYKSIIGIELLNEPFLSIDIYLVKHFYIKAFDIVNAINPNWLIFISDAFRPDLWLNYMNDAKYSNVIIDTHIYHTFEPSLLYLTKTQHIDRVKTVTKQLINHLSLTKPVIIGEFSVAITDCTPHLLGIGTPRRYSNCNNRGYIYNSTFLTNYFNIQIDIFESNSIGWFYWNFKTENPTINSPEWDYLFGVKMGWIKKFPFKPPFSFTIQPNIDDTNNDNNIQNNNNNNTTLNFDTNQQNLIHNINATVVAASDGGNNSDSSNINSINSHFEQIKWANLSHTRAINHNPK